MEKSDKYSQKQKAKYAELINGSQSFKEAYFLAEKKGDLDILDDFIGEIDKRADFINDMWLSAGGNQKQLIEFAAKTGIKELYGRYTPQLGQKIEGLLGQGKLKLVDVLMLVNMNNGVSKDGKTPEEITALKKGQADKISYLLDIFTDPELEVGIHRTGGAVSGKEIKEKGLFLTGHLSSGHVNNVENEDIQSSLDRNVSFYQTSPGIAISQLCTGGHYKNYGQNQFADIVLVGIPKKDLENQTPTEQFVKYDNEQPTLDPKYILGYVTVNNNDNSIHQIEADYEQKQTIDQAYALKQLREGTLDVTKDPEYTSIKSKFFVFLNKLIGKDKEKTENEKNNVIEGK